MPARLHLFRAQSLAVTGITAHLLFLPGLMAHPGHDGGPAAAILAELAAATEITWVTDPGIRNEVAQRTADGFRFITSNGWPDHAPGEFPRRGNPNRISPQKHEFRITLSPQAAESPVFRGGWWWGVALNGVPFEPGTGETWNNDPQSGWRYEAATGFLNLGLDEHNAHVQPTGAYHYHALPKGMVAKLGGDQQHMLLVGWAADGFPLYTARAHDKADDSASPLRAMRSSYQLRKGNRPGGEDGPGGQFDGRFTQDFEFTAGSGDLDECNGRTGVTPEFPKGTYYYCITDNFPFLPRKWRGQPDPSFGKGGPPPGGPGARRGARPGGAPRGILEEPGGGPPPDAGGPPPDGPPGFPGPPPIITALDTDHDGTLSTEELDKAAASLRTLDRNGDGALSPDEYRPAGRPARPGPGE